MNNVFVKGLFFFLSLFGFFLKASENPNATLNPSKENVSVEEQKRFGGVLVFARGADGSSMDPALVTDGESYVATGNIYDTLVQFKYGTTEIEPALATSWEISPDGLVYTFHLRKGVYFHQTKYWNKKVEFSAKDVLFSFERQMHKAKRYYSPGAKSYKYWEGMGMSHIIKSIEALDDYTIRFTLNEPEAPFLANLGMDFLSILSKDYADYLAQNNKKDELAKKPVGTGPFKFFLWNKDEKIILLKNQDYWGPKAYLDKVVVRTIPNPSTRALALRTGEIMLMTGPNLNEVEQLEKVPNIVVDKSAGLLASWLSLNTQKKYFSNPLVRLAINHAINVDDYIKVLYEGFAQKMVNPFPPTIWGYNYNIKPYEYDLKKAKELLKQAGYPNGFKTTIFTTATRNPKGAVFIQASLAKIGIDVKIEVYEWGAYLKRTGLGEHEMAFAGWMADIADPDNFLYTLWSKQAASAIPTQNGSFYKSDAFSDLLLKAKRVSDQKEREALYLKAQEIIHKDAPYVPLAYPYSVVPHLSKVKGYKTTGVNVNRFFKVYLEK